jgi:hypothetical protein
MTIAATAEALAAPRFCVPAPTGSCGEEARCRLFFGAWLAARTLLWTLVATLTQHTPPLDTVEWLCWGRQWQLGYHKHPPLAAWVAEAAFRLTPSSFLGVYLAGYLAIAAALACVWALARRLLPPRPALAAVLCLDGLVFFQQAAAELNNQVLLIAFWALAVWLCHRAFAGDRLLDWLGTGAALGLALLCKYTAVFLAVPLLALWLWRNGPRRWSGPLLVAAVAALIFLPHLVWLCRHDFPTLRYALERAAGEPDGIDNRLSALTFLLSQGVRLLPVGLVLLPLLEGRRRVLDECGQRDRAFVAVAVLGPLALHLAASLGMGMALRDIWGAPLWSFAGLLLVLLLQTRTSERAWRRAALVWGGVVVLSLLLVLAGNLAGGWRGRPLRIHYPGPALAAEVTRRWHERFGVPLPIAAGDWWLAGTVCCHAADRPALYASREPAAFGMDPFARKGDPLRFASPDARTSPWTGDDDLTRHGGVLLWDAGCYGEGLPAWLRRRFPGAEPQEALALPCAGGGPSLHVGWALLAPARR